MFKLVLLLATNALGYEVHVNRIKNYNFIEQYNSKGGEYESTVYFGTPSQEIGHMVLDTGSALPWVKNRDWYNGEGNMPGMTPVYRFSHSNTC